MSPGVLFSSGPHVEPVQETKAKSNTTMTDDDCKHTYMEGFYYNSATGCEVTDEFVEGRFECCCDE